MATSSKQLQWELQDEKYINPSVTISSVKLDWEMVSISPLMTP